jgi:hypothetical protein
MERQQCRHHEKVLTKEISDLFYKESFRKIESINQYLILDLRDNGGGRLNEIVDLYSYLADSTFVFLTSQVVSKSSLMEGAYFNGGSLVKILKDLRSDTILYLLLTVHKDATGKNIPLKQTA